MATPFKSGFIAIIGPPNVGKSTLINTLIGEKVSIVTSKPQTTRNRILGIKNLPQGQLIFVDTPGIHPARKKFNVRLVEIAQAAFRESDVVLMMVEAPGPIPEEAFRYAKKSFQKIQKPTFLVINKIDLINKTGLLPLIEEYQTLFPFREIVPVSALTGSGMDELEKILLNYLPEGPQFFPEANFFLKICILTSRNDSWQQRLFGKRHLCFSRRKYPIPLRWRYRILVSEIMTFCSFGLLFGWKNSRKKESLSENRAVCLGKSGGGPGKSLKSFCIPKCILTFG